MKKPIDTYLKEYCQRLSDENLKFLSQRFTQKLLGDTAEALDFLSSTREIDKWLSSAASCDDFYEMLESLQSIIEKEDEKRQNAA
jgi:hypothetical protein